MPRVTADDESDFSGVSASAGPAGDAGRSRGIRIVAAVCILLLALGTVSEFAPFEITPWAIAWWTPGGADGQLRVSVSDTQGPVPALQVEVPDRSGRLNAATDAAGSCVIPIARQVTDVRVGYMQVISRPRTPLSTARGLDMHVLVLDPAIRQLGQERSN